MNTLPKHLSPKKAAVFLALLTASFVLGPAPAHAVTTLETQHFLLGADGSDPTDGLLKASNGKLYGEANTGGPNEGNALGTIFRLDADGTNFTVIHNFGVGMDGRRPRGGLVEANDGKLYGTTQFGGTGNLGTFFRMDLDGGNYTVLYNFFEDKDDILGTQPIGVVQGSDGNFYGSTHTGGSIDNGTVFRMTPAGEITTIFDFSVATVEVRTIESNSETTVISTVPRPMAA